MKQKQMEEDQTFCPNCKKQYVQENPARLLTMCGHTLCQKCIGGLISQKKGGTNKYKIVCPIDKAVGEIKNCSASCFPKNISIMSLVAKKGCSSLSKNRISDIAHIKQIDSTQSFDFIQNIQQNIPELSLTNTSFEVLSLLDKDFHPDACLLHQKPLDIVCTRDCKKICASCVIFGEHRGHKVKNAAEVAIMENKIKQRLSSILEKSEQIFNNFSDEDTFRKIQTSIMHKKSDLQQTIRKKFKQLWAQISAIQKKTLTKMQRKIQQIKNRLQTMYNEKKNMKNSYAEWQDKINDKLQTLRGTDQQQKIKIVVKDGNFLQECSQTLETIENISKQVRNEADRYLDGLVLVFDEQQLGRVLKQYCKIDELHNSFLDVTPTDIKGIMQQQSLLDDEVVFGNSLSQSNLQNSVSAVNINTKSGLRDKIKSRIFCSPNPSKINKLSSSKSLRTSSINTKLKTPIPHKFQKTIASIINNSTDTLDLTNAELGNTKIIQILSYLHSHQKGINILKLARNKITDQQFSKFQPYLKDVVMLNLSRNQLTDHSFDVLIKWKREGKLPNLRSLILGQNKIMQRKHRNIVEEYKGKGFSICM